MPATSDTCNIAAFYETFRIFNSHVLNSGIPDVRKDNIFNAFSQIAPLTLRVNNLKANRDEILAELENAHKTDFSPDGIVLQNAAVSELECLKDGRVTVQDEASQICVRALGAQKDDVVFDVCACPGSKSFGAAMTMENKGQILAFDIHENKLSLVE